MTAFIYEQVFLTGVLEFWVCITATSGQWQFGCGYLLGTALDSSSGDSFDNWVSDVTPPAQPGQAVVASSAVHYEYQARDMTSYVVNTVVCESK